ncbi:ArsR family transcriptional regulator [Halobacterium zhouii]|uniref:ArsR family transcriptional regulator n=1 Tax=Halobacterium zhouii TaxID=2902624 RepID=UPI001E410EF6|nr:ArsR family transcriptional regulator [Halobacterium zhouii]
MTEEPQPPELNKRNLISDIAGHPHGAPSLEELAYLNPRLSSEEIRKTLQTLIADNAVHTLPASNVDIEDAPERFYRLTKTARNDHSDTEDAWKREYESVSKTERIETLQNLPRPD